MTDDSGKYRVDTARDLGRLEARMGTLEDRFDKQDEFIGDEFMKLHGKLDQIIEAENKRKGAMGLIKVLLGGGTLAGAYEGLRAWLGK